LADQAPHEFTPDYDPLAALIELFKDAEAVVAGPAKADLTLEERLRAHIIDGEKEGLAESLDEAMEKYPPLDIINEHLLDGMKVVGDLFGSGKMQLPFVLQSAETMKKAVAHLEPHMERIEGQSKGVIVLATVKGDVHDIGKNLVDIILTNNGYTVHNIGIKQPISNIVQAWKDTNAHAIGLSGLLVKSVNVMEDNLKELNELGIDVPVILGGAALSRHYAEGYLRSLYNGQCLYGKDAFEGLKIMDTLMAGETTKLASEIEARLQKRSEAERVIAESRAKRAAASEDYKSRSSEGGTATATRSEVATDIEVPAPPFWGSRVVESIKLDDVYPFINPVALFRGQWQFKKGAMSDAEYDASIEDTVKPIFERLKAQCRDEAILEPKVVYGYYPCHSDGNDLIVFDADDHDREIERFTFPRQDGKKRYCISDFFRSVESGEKDVLALHCVTVGTKVSEVGKKLFDNDDYAEYLYLHGMGVETAEALAELWH